MTTTHSADPPDPREPDVHLRAALRHAPDADARPPAALSAAIRREARASMTARPRRRLRGWLGAVTRPGVMPWAGSLASLLVATLAGVLWWREPLPPARETLPGPSQASVAERAASDAAPVASEAHTPSIAAAPAPTPAATRFDAAPAPPRAARREGAAPALQGATAEQRPQPTPPTSEPLALPPPPAAQAGARAGSADNASAPVAGAATPALGRAEAGATDNAAAPVAKSAAPAPNRDAALADTARLRRSAPAEAARESDRAARAGPSIPAGLDDAARAWLARLDAQAGARWQRHDGALPEGRVQRWPEPGPAQVTVVITRDGAYWRAGDDPGATTWFAPLSAQQQHRLGEP